MRRREMSETESQPAVPKTVRRSYRLTPGRCLTALLAVESLLSLSERFGWLPWQKGYAVLTVVSVANSWKFFVKAGGWGDVR